MRYSYLINKRKKNWRKNSNDSGYTLIELLAIIVVLSLIIGIVIVFANGIINNAKEKSYKVSASNIENVAYSYAIENHMKYEWIDNETDDSKEYFCVSVGDLIEMGFLDNEALDSYIGKDEKVKKTDYIYLERDINSKSITKNLLVPYHKGKYGDYCGNYNTGVDIEFIEEPSGWAKEKTLTIKYKIFNLIDDMSKYEYRYDASKINKDTIDNKKFNNLIETEVIENITSNGIVDAYVKSDTLDENKKIDKKELYKITGIDRNTPLIQLSLDNKNTEESKIIGREYAKSRNVTISLVDNQSGLKKGRYTINYDWSLENKSCDELTKSIVLDVSDTSNIVSKDVIISNETGKGKLYVCGEGVSDNVNNVRDNKIDSIDLYLDNSKPIVTLGNYSGSLSVKNTVTIPILTDDLDSGFNKNSFEKEDIDVFVGGQKIISGVNLLLVSEKKYNLKIDSVSINGEIILKIASDKVLDNVGNGNDEILLDTNISFNNVYTISYDANGGSGAPGNQTKTHGKSLTLSSKEPSRVGYQFLGWSTDKDSLVAMYNSGYSYTEDKSVTLYAVWYAVKNPIMSIKCANVTYGEFPYIMTYTGNCSVHDDGNNNWRIKFLTSGNLNSTEDFDIDAFLVGGGGGGGRGQNGHEIGGGGGGGGYTKTRTTSIVKNKSYKIVIGEGGDSRIDGGDTSAFGFTADGGEGSFYDDGGNGGSGGAGGSKHSGKSGGSNGGNGATSSSGGGGGNGQGTTTCEFDAGTYGGSCNEGVTMYAGGGGSGGGGSNYHSNGKGGDGGGADGTGPDTNAYDADPNTGGGGGGAGYRSWGGKGGSGIVVIRNAKQIVDVLVDFTYTGDYIYLNDGSDNWRIKFLTSGVFIPNEDINMDVFLVGGGGGGGRGQSGYGKGGGGGGGGYVTNANITVKAGKSYNVVIGEGGVSREDGTASTAFGFTAKGGKGSFYSEGGTGGSGGGGGGTGSGASGGSNGENGNKLTGGEGGGTGQGTTTREFGDENGRLYAGGGGGGGYDSGGKGGSGGSGGGGNGGGGGGGGGTDGMMNTGGGGGGGGERNSGADGGTGIVVVRNKR